MPSAPRRWRATSVSWRRCVSGCRRWNPAPQARQGWLLLGNAERERGRPQAAIEAWRRALDTRVDAGLAAEIAGVLPDRHRLRAERHAVERRLVAVFEPLRQAIVYNEAKWASVDILNQALWITLLILYVAIRLLLQAWGG